MYEIALEWGARAWMQPDKLRLLRKAEDADSHGHDANSEEADEPGSPVDSDTGLGEGSPLPNDERAPDFREFRWDPASADDWL